jgi:hypothetical protein
MKKLAMACMWVVCLWALEAEGKIATLRDRVVAEETKEGGTRPFNWALGLQATTPFGAWFAKNEGGLKVTQNIFNQLQIGSAATLEFPTKMDGPRWALGASATFGKFQAKGFDMRLTNAGLWLSSPRLIPWPLVRGQWTPRLIIDYQGTGFDVWRAGMVRKATAHFFWMGGEMRLHFPELANIWVATGMAFPVATTVNIEGYKDEMTPGKTELQSLTYVGLRGLRMQLSTGVGLFGFLRTRLGLSYLVLHGKELSLQQLQPNIQLGLEF